MTGLSFHLFLPQMRLSISELVDRARAAEAAGFEGLALMDHLVPPAAPGHPMFEAFTTATWLAAHTDRLTISHLVLCDAFRHPAVLARQAVTLDHASGGRFELGIGSGSVPEELQTYGIPAGTARERTAQLADTLEMIDALWSGTGDGPAQLPLPLGRIPIVIGGTGPRTMELVARHADWWNVPVHHLDRVEALRPSAGRARLSVQQLVTFVPDGADRDEVVSLADRRFGWMAGSGRLVGDGPELVAQLRELAARGVERVYPWFTDFAPPATLEAFGREVIPHLA